MVNISLISANNKLLMIDFLKEFWQFLAERKKWWLLPMVIVLLLVAVLIVVGGGSAAAPFVYTLF